MANHQQPNTGNPNHPEVTIIPVVNGNPLGPVLVRFIENLSDKDDPIRFLRGPAKSPGGSNWR